VLPQKLNKDQQEDSEDGKEEKNNKPISHSHTLRCADIVIQNNGHRGLEYFEIWGLMYCPADEPAHVINLICSKMHNNFSFSVSLQ
jgi:hypothetical protein